MDETRIHQLERKFLQKYIFFDLKNLNNGFDSENISYFSESDFETVLRRVSEMGLGIYGIEPWKDGEFFGVEVHEEVTTDPKDPKWYFQSFERFRKIDRDLQYSATYYIPENLLERNDL